MMPVMLQGHLQINSYAVMVACGEAWCGMYSEPPLSTRDKQKQSLLCIDAANAVMAVLTNGVYMKRHLDIPEIQRPAVLWRELEDVVYRVQASGYKGAHEFAKIVIYMGNTAADVDRQISLGLINSHDENSFDTMLQNISLESGCNLDVSRFSYTKFQKSRMAANSPFGHLVQRMYEPC